MLFNVIVTCAFIACSIISVNAQAPAIGFSQTYGGSSADVPNALMQTGDRGYIIAGGTRSSDGQINTTLADTQFGDLWVVKTDSSGKILWQRTLFGNHDDIVRAVVETPSAYVFAGLANSKNGDYSSFTSKSSTAFILWLDKANGSIIQIREYPGEVFSEFCGMRNLDDKYLIVTGANAPNKNSAGVYAARQLWVAKLELNGNMVWQKTYGGKDDDWGWAISPKPKTSNNKDRGYIISGYTFSNSYDVTGNHGATDAWIIDLDSNGNKHWAKCYGGNNADWVTNITGVQQFEGTQIVKEEYILSGSTLSTTGDLQGIALGNEDYWALKIDDTGKVIWSKTYGGSGVDWHTFPPSNTIPDSNGTLLYGHTSSRDGDASGRPQNISSDLLLVRIDNDGNKLWSKTIGSALGEGNTGNFIFTCDGGYAITEGVAQVTQDVTGTTFGSMEIWLCKLNPDGTSYQKCPPYQAVPVGIIQNSEFIVPTFKITPNPASTLLHIEIANIDKNREWQISVSDMTGRIVASKFKSSATNTMDISSLSTGIYIVQLSDGVNTLTQKLVRE